jgi:hypothetical protein
MVISYEGLFESLEHAGIGLPERPGKYPARLVVDRWSHPEYGEQVEVWVSVGEVPIGEDSHL